MTRTQIDCFLSTARTGSFAAASRELYLSVQVVSQHIQNLEKELGVRLFSRGRDGVSVTDDGKILLDFAARWIGLYNHTIQSIRETYDSAALKLHIGMSEYIDSVGRVSGGLAAFAREHPLVDVTGAQYSNRTILSEVSADHIDVALMCDTQIVSGGDFGLAPFAREELRLYLSCAPKIDPSLRPGAPALREILSSLPHLNASYGPWSQSEWLEISQRMDAYLGLSFQETRAVTNFRSVIASVGLIPCAVVCDARFGYLKESENVQSIPLGVESGLCCVWNKASENPLIPEFVKHMQQFYAE